MKKEEGTTLTTEIIIDGEYFTIVVHRVKYKLSGEEEPRYIDVATNIPGKINDIDEIIIGKEIKETAIEAITIMNDNFVEVEDKENPFVIYSYELMNQPI